MQLRTFVIPIILAAGLAGSDAQASAKVLRVCADPDYLPYSNRAGEGFENKIAVAVAKALGATVEYTSASYRGHGGFPQFLATTLDANKCDVVMNIPYAMSVRPSEAHGAAARLDSATSKIIRNYGPSADRARILSE